MNILNIDTNHNISANNNMQIDDNDIGQSTDDGIARQLKELDELGIALPDDECAYDSGCEADDGLSEESDRFYLNSIQS